jgi:hypothetical protein
LILFENQFQMVRLLKGAPISVLYVLMLSEKMKLGPASNEFLERSTGYSDKPICQALALLDDYGLVGHGRNGWVLATEAAQLPLMNIESEISDNNLNPLNSLDRLEPIANGGVSRRISESENFRSSSSSLTKLDSRFNDPLPDSRADQSENFRLVADEMDKAGIREPARSRLARLDHMSVNLVRYHCETSSNIGQAIFRIEHNWKIRPGWAPAAELPGIQEEPEEPDQEDDPIEEENETWKNVLGILRMEMSKALFDTWVSCLKPIGLNDQQEIFTVRAMNPYGKEMVESRLAKTIERQLSGLMCREIKLVVCV